MKSTIDKINKWFKSQCDGDWEHEYGIEITSTSDPGWLVVIDLQFTKNENIEVPLTRIENNKNDWYYFKIESKKFIGSCDSSNLEFILNKFLNLIDQNQEKVN